MNDQIYKSTFIDYNSGNNINPVINTVVEWKHWTKPSWVSGAVVRTSWVGTLTVAWWLVTSHLVSPSRSCVSSPSCSGWALFCRLSPPVLDPWDCQCRRLIGIFDHMTPNLKKYLNKVVIEFIKEDWKRGLLNALVFWSADCLFGSNKRKYQTGKLLKHADKM